MAGEINAVAITKSSHSLCDMYCLYWLKCPLKGLHTNLRVNKKEIHCKQILKHFRHSFTSIHLPHTLAKYTQLRRHTNNVLQ